MTVRWLAPSDLFQVTRTMDRLLDEALGTGGQGRESAAAPPTYTLPVDIMETEKAYMLIAPVPGLAPEAVEVTFDGGVLSITAQAAPIQVDGAWLRQERPHGNWIRRLQLPDQVLGDQISADFENGLLTVTVPKAEKPQPVRIPVRGSAPARSRKALSN